MTERSRTITPIGGELAAVLQRAKADVEANSTPEALTRRATRDREMQRRLDAERKAQWRRNMQAGMLTRDWEEAWSASEDWPAVQHVKHWIDGGCKRHMFLFGPKGVGKTFGAGYAVKRWVEPDDSGAPRENVSWMHSTQLVSAVFHSYDPSAPRIGTHNVIDDIGVEIDDRFEAALIVLMERNVTIIATSNLVKEQWRARFTDPRLLERSNHYAIAVRLKGESRRRQDGGF